MFTVHSISFCILHIEYHQSELNNAFFSLFHVWARFFHGWMINLRKNTSAWRGRWALKPKNRKNFNFWNKYQFDCIVQKKGCIFDITIFDIMNVYTSSIGIQKMMTVKIEDQQYPIKSGRGIILFKFSDILRSGYRIISIKISSNELFSLFHSNYYNFTIFWSFIFTIIISFFLIDLNIRGFRNCLLINLNLKNYHSI